MLYETVDALEAHGTPIEACGLPEADKSSTVPARHAQCDHWHRQAPKKRKKTKAGGLTVSPQNSSVQGQKPKGVSNVATYAAKGAQCLSSLGLTQAADPLPKTPKRKRTRLPTGLVQHPKVTRK